MGNPLDSIAGTIISGVILALVLAVLIKVECISKRVANEVNGLSFLCPRWKSLKAEDANGLPYLLRAGPSESAPF
jgi:hypothetical protein